MEVAIHPPTIPPLTPELAALAALALGACASSNPSTTPGVTATTSAENTASATTVTHTMASATQTAGSATEDLETPEDETPEETQVQSPTNGVIVADITQATVTGSAQNYTFAVTIKSPDLGCKQYADWWEVLSEDGALLYRRVLSHSHTTEQPFTRSGGPVPIAGDTPVYIRGHMNPSGYGGVVMTGSVDAGFTIAEDLDSDFAADVESQEPLPSSCAY